MNRGQGFLLFVLAAVSAVLLYLVSPFLDYVLFAVVLGYVLYPVHRRLSRHVGDFVSPLVIITASVFVVVLPVVYVGNRFLRDIQAVSRGETGVQTQVIEDWFADNTALDLDFQEGVQAFGEIVVDNLFGDVPALVSTLLELSLGFGLVMFLLFYLLRDGAEFVEWLLAAVPLPDHVSDQFVDQIDRTTWGAVVGHVFAALAEALVAGLGLYVVGIPNVFFWTFVMFLLAFLPIIGAFLVWGPAAFYLYLVGQTTAGVLLALYGVVFVSLIDNYVRPLVIDQRARLNPAVLLIGVFGGLYTLGFVGMFVGPIAIGVFVATVRTIQKDYADV